MLNLYWSLLLKYVDGSAPNSLELFANQRLFLYCGVNKYSRSLFMIHVAVELYSIILVPYEVLQS